MEDGHKYKFGQMPTRKTKLGSSGSSYRRLEIGEVIQEGDYWELKQEYISFWVFSVIGGQILNDANVHSRSELIEQRYNPIREHKHLIIWRKEE